MKAENGKFLFLSALFLIPLTSCSGVDWNWDTSWWEKPKRVVKPQPRPSNSPVEQQRAAESLALSHPQKQEIATTTTTPPESAPSAAEGTVTEPAYYQLYLVSKSKKTTENRGEFTAHIGATSAHTAAGLLETLYVPVGRSGSRDACYLLYENAAEFNAAVHFAKLLSAHDKPDDVSGLALEMQKPLALYYQLVDRGPVVERPQIEKCLVEWSAVSTAKLPQLQGWAAAIVTGKLLADYEYDYSRARDSYERAAQGVPDGSLEKKTAMWWIAESFAQEGRRDQAIAMYEKILSSYGEKEQNSQIVRRSEANIDRLKKR